MEHTPGMLISLMAPKMVNTKIIPVLWFDKKSKKVTFGDNGSLLMRIVSDILELKRISYIEDADEE